MLDIQTVKTDWTNGVPAGLTWYFIGQPKTGKTTQAASWSPKGSEGVLLIDTDLGSDFVDGAKVITCTSLMPPIRAVTKDGIAVTKNGEPQQEIIPPEERGYFHRNGSNAGTPLKTYSLGEILKDLETNWADYKIDTIVLDTIDQINAWIEDAVVDDLGISAMGEGQWGSDWATARKKNLDIVVRMQRFLKMVGGNLIIISHAKPTMVVDNKAQLGPNLPRGLSYGLTAKADIIGYTSADKETGDMEISFEAYDERMVGSRLRPLSQQKLLFDYGNVMKTIKSYKEKGAE
jgi:hypothetical protein